MPDLTQRKCKPCSGETDPLQGEKLQKFMADVPEWTLVEDRRIEREFRFDDFAEALDFATRVGALAEEEGHHPEITFTWGRATIRLRTHAIGGLSENDFILAAKIDAMSDV